MSDIKEVIKKEYLKCAQDPAYFLKKYAVIQHPIQGKIPFSLYEFNPIIGFPTGMSISDQTYIGLRVGPISGAYNSGFGLKIGDFSMGWSYEMQHSPQMELTKTFSNESIKTVTTKGGHTLSNSGWNKQPSWVYPPWMITTTTGYSWSPSNITYPAGRRSWSLKFSYLADDHSDSTLFSNKYNTTLVIFEGLSYSTAGTEDATDDIWEYNVKKDFMNRVWYSTNCGQLPFIFCPDTSPTDLYDREYAICRFDTNSIKFNQVANGVFNVKLKIREVW